MSLDITFPYQTVTSYVQRNFFNDQYMERIEYSTDESHGPRTLQDSTLSATFCCLPGLACSSPVTSTQLPNEIELKHSEIFHLTLTVLVRNN